MPLSPAERAQVDRYGAEDLMDSPSLTPDQRRELEDLADEEEADEDEDEVDEIPANQAMRRLRGPSASDADALPAWLGKNVREDAMTLDYSEDALDELSKSLFDRLDLVDELPRERREIRKAIEALSDDLTHQAWDTRRLAHRMGALQEHVAVAYQAQRRSRRNQAAIGRMAKALDGFFEGIK